MARELRQVVNIHANRARMWRSSAEEKKAFTTTPTAPECGAVFSHIGAIIT
jgi:hypothetical protein